MKHFFSRFIMLRAKGSTGGVILKLGTLAVILGTVALPAPTAWATDYVISGAATTTNDGATLSTGDTLTITATGSVTTSGISGVETMAGGTIITHNGPITTTALFAHGIVAGTDMSPLIGDVTILGTGDIWTLGNYARGISSTVTTGDATITAGDISTQGDDAAGIYSDVTNGDATITAGDISTAAYGAYGIYSWSYTTGNSTITAGDIATQGDYSWGIYSVVDAGDAIIKAGDISTEGEYADGISSTVSTGDATITAGDISTEADAADGISLVLTTGNATITAGDILTEGDYAYGIYSFVSTGDASITAGNISTQGDYASGISSVLTTGNATITVGDISTEGDAAEGISSRVTTGDATITTGDISTAGYGAYGIYSAVDTGNATITAGDISTEGDYAHGIRSYLYNSGTANVSIVNDYSIAVTGAAADGIHLDTSNDHVRIVNTGTISSAQRVGIYTSGFGTDTVIINSGMISGTEGAVFFEDRGNTLSLLAGSKIVGLLRMVGRGGNTLSIGKRLNTALKYTYAGLTLETNGIPYTFANVGNYRVVAVVDPTLFAAEDDMVADLSRSVGNAIDARLGSAIGQSANDIMASTSNAQATVWQWETWATGLASYREQGEDGLNDGFDTTLGGFALGSDTVLSSGTRFGGFVGASRAHLNTNAGNEQIDSASTYAGLYARYTLPNAFVNLAVTGGSAKADTSRDVLNNMVAGGIEQAKGAPDGIFITPQATIGTQIKNASGILTPSLRIAYTHLAMDSYAETGSTANMTVAARTVSTLDLRGQVAFAIKPIVTSTGQIDATMRLGADASFSNSDDISATLLDQPITFSTSQDTGLRSFAGFDLAQKMDNGAQLHLSLEAGYGSNNAVNFQTTTGLVWAF